MKVSFHYLGEKNYSSIILVNQHKNIWHKYGQDILNGFLKVTGANFTIGFRVNITIKDPGEVDPYTSDWSHSGMTERLGILLCYQNIYVIDSHILKELIHEMCHKIMDQNKIILADPGPTRIDNIHEDHLAIFTFLIDVINQSFDSSMAQEILNLINKNYEGMAKNEVDSAYLRAWQWANKLTKQQRQILTHRMFEKKNYKLEDLLIV